MFLLGRLLAAVMPLAFLIGGCHEVFTPPGTAPLPLNVSWLDPQQDEPVPLEGAQLCQADEDNCELTDTKGRAVLRLPVGQTSYTLEKEGYASYLVGVDMPLTSPQPQFVMSTDPNMVAQHGRLMSPYPMRGTGTILIELDTAFEGATFTLSDATGRRYYADEEGKWSLDLSATSPWGSGGFVEVSPGEFQIELGGEATRCIPFRWGWTGDVENSVSVPVRVGYVSLAAMECPVLP